MKNRFSLAAVLTASLLSLGGCAGVKILAEAPYQIVHQNVLDVQCSMKSNILVGTCKAKDFADCAPNYPVVKECRENLHWSCMHQGVRMATAMDPTLGVCPGSGIQK